MRNLLLLLTLGLFAAGAGAAGYGKQKVVYHINGDEPKQQSAALGNIQNHVNAVGQENIDIKVVLHGGGLSLLQHARNDADMKAKVDKLKLQGVAFNICNNTLKAKKLDYKTDLYDVAEKDIVPSGVAEIAHLQKLGYTYVKP